MRKSARRRQRGRDLAAEDAGVRLLLLELVVVEAVAGAGLDRNPQAVGLAAERTVAVLHDHVERVAGTELLGDTRVLEAVVLVQQILEALLGLLLLRARRAGAHRELAVVNDPETLRLVQRKAPLLQEVRIDHVRDRVVADHLEDAVRRTRLTELDLDEALEVGRVAARRIEVDALLVLARLGADDHRDRCTAAGDGEVRVLHRDRELVAGTDHVALGQVADENVRVVDFAVRRQLPLAVEEASLRVRQVDREDLAQLLDALVEVLAVKRDQRHEVVGLRLNLAVVLAEPVLKRRLGALDVAGRDLQVHRAEHRLLAVLGRMIRRIVAERLVLELRGLEVLLVAVALGTGEDHRRRHLGRDLRLLRENRRRDLTRLQEKLVLLAAVHAQLLDAPDHEVRRQLQRLALEHGLVLRILQDLPRALRVLLRELVRRHVERIRRIVLADRIDARKRRSKLGAVLGRERDKPARLVAGDGVDIEVERLVGSRRLEVLQHLL